MAVSSHVSDISVFAGHAGVDEAGRGCLAGPVVAAAALFIPEFSFRQSLPGLDDSKKMTAPAREKLAPAIKCHALAWGIGLSWPAEIDRVNILNATFRAMSRAVAAMKKIGPLPPLVIDGNHTIRPDAWLAATNRPAPEQKAVIDGDALIPQIAAASVLAKTFRDRLMQKLDARHPGYGFAIHKGYGTVEHRTALIVLGPCSLHRRTFRGVRTEERQLTLF
ncbi:MAG: ribonuclease HII [Deltaproteobacteria bacterium]|nr:ribonuclease HII [Deltaproteobacteria bacterium]